MAVTMTSVISFLSLFLPLVWGQTPIVPTKVCSMDTCLAESNPFWPAPPSQYFLSVCADAQRHLTTVTETTFTTTIGNGWQETYEGCPYYTSEPQMRRRQIFTEAWPVPTLTDAYTSPAVTASTTPCTSGVSSASSSSKPPYGHCEPWQLISVCECHGGIMPWTATSTTAMTGTVYVDALTMTWTSCETADAPITSATTVSITWLGDDWFETTSNYTPLNVSSTLSIATSTATSQATPYGGVATTSSTKALTTTPCSGYPGPNATSYSSSKSSSSKWTVPTLSPPFPTANPSNSTILPPGTAPGTGIPSSSPIPGNTSIPVPSSSATVLTTAGNSSTIVNPSTPTANSSSSIITWIPNHSSYTPLPPFPTSNATVPGDAGTSTGVPASGTAPPGTAPPGTAPPGTAPPGTAPPGTAPPGTAPTQPSSSILWSNSSSVPPLVPTTYGPPPTVSISSLDLTTITLTGSSGTSTLTTIVSPSFTTRTNTTVTSVITISSTSRRTTTIRTTRSSTRSSASSYSHTTATPSTASPRPTSVTSSSSAVLSSISSPSSSWTIEGSGYPAAYPPASSIPSTLSTGYGSGHDTSSSSTSTASEPPPSVIPDGPTISSPCVPSAFNWTGAWTTSGYQAIYAADYTGCWGNPYDQEFGFMLYDLPSGLPIVNVNGKAQIPRDESDYDTAYYTFKDSRSGECGVWDLVFHFEDEQTFIATWGDGEQLSYERESSIGQGFGSDYLTTVWSIDCGGNLRAGLVGYDEYGLTVGPADRKVRMFHTAFVPPHKRRSVRKRMQGMQIVLEKVDVAERERKWAEKKARLMREGKLGMEMGGMDVKMP